MLNKFKNYINKTSYFQYYYGKKSYDSGNLRISNEFIRKSLSINPYFAPAIDVLICIGVLEKDNKIISEAINPLLNKKRLNQYNLLNLVKGLYHLEEYDKATTYLNKIKKPSYKIDVLKYKGKILLNNKDYQESNRIFNEINNLERGSNPYTLVDLGASLVGLGKIEEGISYYNKAKRKGDKYIKDYVDNLVIEVEET